MAPLLALVKPLRLVLSLLLVRLVMLRLDVPHLARRAEIARIVLLLLHHATHRTRPASLVMPRVMLRLLRRLRQSGVLVRPVRLLLMQSRLGACKIVLTLRVMLLLLRYSPLVRRLRLWSGHAPGLLGRSHARHVVSR